MAVHLRLQRIGKPKRPFYRVVAIDQRAKRDGKPIEILGQYDPKADDDKLNVKMDRINYWLGTGAKPTETVSVLIKKSQVSQENKEAQ
jgi:small subunit ribosomal protein S16